MTELQRETARALDLGRPAKQSTALADLYARYREHHGVVLGDFHLTKCWKCVDCGEVQRIDYPGDYCPEDICQGNLCTYLAGPLEAGKAPPDFEDWWT